MNIRSVRVRPYEPAGVWYGPEPMRPVRAVRASGCRGGWRYNVVRGRRPPLDSGLPVRRVRNAIINAAAFGKSLNAVARELGIGVALLRDVLVWCLLNPEKAGRL